MLYSTQKRGNECEYPYNRRRRTTSTRNKGTAKKAKTTG